LGLLFIVWVWEYFNFPGSARSALGSDGFASCQRVEKWVTLTKGAIAVGVEQADKLFRISPLGSSRLPAVGSVSRFVGL
jgi:hypothetical protein